MYQRGKTTLSNGWDVYHIADEPTRITGGKVRIIWLLVHNPNESRWRAVWATVSDQTWWNNYPVTKKRLLLFERILRDDCFLTWRMAQAVFEDLEIPAYQYDDWTDCSWTKESLL